MPLAASRRPEPSAVSNALDLAAAIRSHEPLELLTSLLVMVHRTDAGHSRASWDMGDGLLYTDPDDLTDEQRRRLIDQGAIAAALKLAAVAVRAMATGHAY
ncbi:hypothetical protein [Candidatus Poriferisocius sp.]|uniref:hypothetical protein n=1 Tax=Candidatus Poriferisocius sp. TaxID=3101276 RepID=UPI003B02D462